MDYDDYQTTSPSAAPPWLSDPKGWLWNKCLGIMKQAAVEATKSAVVMRFASHSPIDALIPLLEDRALDPPYDEDETSVRQRVRKAWATWMKAGTKAAIVEALQLAGYTNFEIREQPQDGTLKWWEFEVWLFPPFPWNDQYLADGRWDDPGVWSDGGVWAPDMPAADLSRLRAAIRKWKGVHALCRHIVVVHAGETWDATAPPGTWDDDPDAIWGDDVSVLSP